MASTSLVWPLTYASLSDAQETTLAEMERLVCEAPEEAVRLSKAAFSICQLPSDLLDPVINHIAQSPQVMTRSLMRFHHSMPEETFGPKRAYLSALTISLGYFLGGFVPLLPYFFFSTIRSAFLVSVVIMIIVLFVFGAVKTVLVGKKEVWHCVKGGMQMVVVGGLAAAAAIGCVRAVKDLVPE